MLRVRLFQDGRDVDLRRCFHPRHITVYSSGPLQEMEDEKERDREREKKI